MEQLSGVMIIIIIGGGVLTFVMLFIFAKRQIMRFTLRSRRGPHVPIGHDAKKAQRRELERRLDCIQKICQEPKLLWTDDKTPIISQPIEPLPPYYYRMKAVDDVKVLESEILRGDGCSVRHASESLRAFLLTTLSVALNGSGQRLVHQFCDMYEHARHDPNEFESEEYTKYHRIFMKLIDAAKQLKTISNANRASPARTPKNKQTKMHSLLDPARLRPPPINSTTESGDNIPPSSELTAGQNSKVNLTLGLQGGDLDISDISNNSMHIQTQAERDNIIRNRIKTPTLHDDDNDDIVEDNDNNENEITNANDGDVEIQEKKIDKIDSDNETFKLRFL